MSDETVNVRYLVDDVATGVDFYCNEIVTGPVGKQIRVGDPSGNPIELLPPAE